MIIASTFEQPEDYQFQGHCFVDEDLIIGDLGATEYYAATGALPEPGLDGCYVTVIPKANGWVFGTDSRGLAKLFVYKRGEIWAVGSSLFGLVRHLRRNGVYPIPKVGEILVSGVAGSFTDQPASLEMSFQNVELVPSFCTVSVDRQGSVNILPLPEPDNASYEESLIEYLSVWSSRLETILQHPDSRITADLSGGIDSRAVFAFLDASKKFDSNHTDRFRLVSNKSMTDDYAVASKIAEDYQLEINGPVLRSRVRQQPQTALAHWRAHSLGVYMPVYINNSGFDPLTIQAHGAGGGANRQTLTDESIAAKLAKYKTKMKRADFVEWATSISESLVRLAKLRPDVDPLILHYREFRNRFHFGHRPQRRVMFTPLNSILVDALTLRTGVSSRQHFYDIMESLSPGLTEYAYDVPEKMPTLDERKNLTTVSYEVIRDGKIYGVGHEAQPPRENVDNAYQVWLSECESLLNYDELQSILGDERVALCRNTLEEARQSTQPLRANHAGIVELAISYALGFALDIPLGTFQ